jgi:hypothetical protein
MQLLIMNFLQPPVTSSLLGQTILLTDNSRKLYLVPCSTELVQCFVFVACHFAIGTEYDPRLMIRARDEHNAYAAVVNHLYGG